MRKRTSHLILALGACSLTVVQLAGCLHSVDPRSDNCETLGDWDRLTQSAMSNYSQGLAENFARVANDLEQGNLRNAEAAHSQLRDQNAKIREQAFQELSAAIESEIGEDRFTPERAARLFRRIASAMKGRKS